MQMNNIYFHSTCESKQSHIFDFFSLCENSLNFSLIDQRASHRPCRVLLVKRNRSVVNKKLIPIHWIYLGVLRLITGISTAIILTCIPLIFADQMSPQ